MSVRAQNRFTPAELCRKEAGRWAGGSAVSTVSSFGSRISFCGDFLQSLATFVACVG